MSAGNARFRFVRNTPALCQSVSICFTSQSAHAELRSIPIVSLSLSLVGISAWEPAPNTHAFTHMQDRFALIFWCSSSEFISVLRATSTSGDLLRDDDDIVVAVAAAVHLKCGTQPRTHALNHNHVDNFSSGINTRLIRKVCVFGRLHVWKWTRT